MHTTIDELTAGIARLSDTARAVVAWAQSSGLRLNVGKTKAIIFGSKYNINLVHELQLPGIEVDDGVVVPFVDTVKNLGVIMDSKLTWKEHVDHVTKTVNRVLYSLKFFKSSTTEALRKQLVDALAMPHIDYCSIVFLDVNDRLREKLQKSQNSCVRYICGVKWDEHITPYRFRIGWANVDERRSYFSALLLYKIIRMGQPSYLAKYFVKNNNRTSARSAARGLVSDLNSFKAKGAQLWNAIPSSVKFLPSFCQFKKALRSTKLYILY